MYVRTVQLLYVVPLFFILVECWHPGWHSTTYKMEISIFCRDDSPSILKFPSFSGWKAKWKLSFPPKITVVMEELRWKAKWHVNPACWLLGPPYVVLCMSFYVCRSMYVVLCMSFYVCRSRQADRQACHEACRITAACWL
jgi:hypothetical protein